MIFHRQTLCLHFGANRNGKLMTVCFVGTNNPSGQLETNPVELFCLFSVRVPGESSQKYSRSLGQAHSQLFHLSQHCIISAGFPCFLSIFLQALASLIYLLFGQETFFSLFKGCLIEHLVRKLKTQLVFHYRGTMVPRTDVLYYFLS